MDVCPNCHHNLDSRPTRNGLAESHIVNSVVYKEKHYREYSYEPLPKYSRFIRVLVLLGNGSHNAEVECELLPVDFTKEHLEHTYEALSWCWGKSKPTGRLVIRKSEKDKKDKRLSKSVTPDLVAALRALRYQTKDRYLWIDQVCIDQDNPLEKNHQVEMMSEIYGRASKVCIWLGEGDRSSQMALAFIEEEVLQLQNFDELCESEQASKKWEALLDLMQRPWFSRRWVVQEIALAHSTVVYCGADKISWKKFAVAVELFVEVETATHRLSEVMKKDPRNYHVPGWFEYVSALGASLLVEATGKLFRDYKPNGPTQYEGLSNNESDSEVDETDEEESMSDIASREEGSDSGRTESIMARSLGQPLLTLEYLVSSLSIFEVTKPHDAIYALLAIARDTTPFADDIGGFRTQLSKTQTTLEGFTQKKRYTVDYQQPYADVCQEFVEFCIEGSKDATRALDIICRPWAPELIVETKNDKHRPGSVKAVKRSPSSSRTISRARSSGNLDINNALSRLPSRGPSPHLDIPSVPSLAHTPSAQRKQEMLREFKKEVPLPSWIQSLSGAAYAMCPQPGIHTLKMGRKNADTFVGLPASSQSLERNYNAAETRGVDSKTLCFIKRSGMKHWAMYVKGFILDKVLETQPSSQGGAIPRSWAKAGGWKNVPESDPPDDFWRTLVADRAGDGKNPPVYYSRACRESFTKGGWSSGSVNMTDLINKERCSVIAQFCRRVQAVIWNRCLITTKSNTLGLAGQDVRPEDFVCILYGCSVPVALRRVRKTKESVEQQCRDELRTFQEKIFTRSMRLIENRKYRTMMHICDSVLNTLREEKMRKAWLKDSQGREAWKGKMARTKVEQTAEKSPLFKVTMEGESGPFEISACPNHSNTKKLASQRHTEAVNGSQNPRLEKRGDEVNAVALNQQSASAPIQIDRVEGNKKVNEGEPSHQYPAKGTRDDVEKSSKPEIGSGHLKNFEGYTSFGHPIEDPDTIGEKDQEGIRIARSLSYEITGQERRTFHEDLENGVTDLSTSQQSQIDKRESVEELLERRGYMQWMSSKRKNKSKDTPEQWFRRMDKRTFELQLRYFCRWKVRCGEKVGGRIRPSKRISNHRRIGIREISSDYIEEYNKRYYKPYVKEGVTELEEPDWKSNEKEDLCIRDRWYYYEFLGECYVHGMMDGEAMAYQNRKEIPRRMFELR